MKSKTLAVKDAGATEGETRHCCGSPVLGWSQSSA